MSCFSSVPGKAGPNPEGDCYMDTKKIVEDSGKPEMRPFFMPNIIPSIHEGKVQPHKAGDEIKEAPETAWKFISPEMMPMPGTPDFCEFHMDGVV